MKNKWIIISITLFVICIAIFSYFFFKKSNVDIKLKNNNDDSIAIISPIKNSEISSPLLVSGRARGNWFFEGSFPITLLDSYRNTIAEGHVTAQGEWMTNDLVRFVGNIQFNNYIKGSKGFLILKRDNPSGLPQNDQSVEIPIIFK